MRQIHRKALALGLVLALSACGGDPEPRFEEDPSPAPSEVTTSAPVKEAWEEKSDDGAIAFVEHWVDEFNQMQTTGEVNDFRQLGTPNCAACDNFVDITRDIYEEATVESKGWSIEAADVPRGQSGSARDISVQIQQAPETITYEDGRVERNDGGQLTVVMTTRWAGDTWQMDSVEFPS